MTRIESLHVYPVKSCRGIELHRARVGTTGIEHDREWMVVTPAGRFLTQRELPRLALIEPALEPDLLRLTAPGRAALEIPLAHDGPAIEVTVWRDRCAALDAGDRAAEWLTDFLGRELRLVRFAPTAQRPSQIEGPDGVTGFAKFADAFALLAISTASLADLNARLDVPLPMNRFRPNVVLSGLAPYDEDRVFELEREGVRLRAVKPCTRCAITTTDQSRGEVVGDEPLRTLKTYRWSAELRGVMFGQNLIVIVPGELEVGQELAATWRE
jgi:uncharacterized protein YcbX